MRKMLRSRFRVARVSQVAINESFALWSFVLHIDLEYCYVGIWMFGEQTCFGLKLNIKLGTNILWQITLLQVL